jgi:hypothetical protein
MSKAMMRSKPLARALPAAPTTPPAGPESTVRTGSLAAAASAAIPPLDCITKIRGAGAEARFLGDIFAALKRRSSTKCRARVLRFSR